MWLQTVYKNIIAGAFEVQFRSKTVAVVPQSRAVNALLDSFPKDSLSMSGVYPYLCFLSGVDSLRYAHLSLVHSPRAVCSVLCYKFCWYSQ